MNQIPPAEHARLERWYLGVAADYQLAAKMNRQHAAEIAQMWQCALRRALYHRDKKEGR